MRVVLDTNVWVSAFLNPLGTPGQILRAVGADIEVLTTEHLWSELHDVIHRPRVQEVLESKELWDSVRLLVAIHPRVEFVEEDAPREHWLLADPDDDWVIQCAITGKADAIVTGDKALLALGEVDGIRILSAAAFVDEVLKGTP